MCIKFNIANFRKPLTTMNTTAKGNKFEDKIYQIFKGLLEDEKLPVNRKQSVIKKKRNIIQKLEKST